MRHLRSNFQLIRDEENRRRFYAKVARSDNCWRWTGSTKNGYGMFYIDGRVHRAHRIAWEFERGFVPKGLCVLHHCDNRRCVRVEHLFLGTYQDNADDAKKKGRRK